MLNVEIWKDVDNLPYEVSSFGTVRRKAGTRHAHKNKTHVVPYINNKGYLCVNLYLNSKVHKYLVHRLMALTFIPNPMELPDVNHIDGNPLNVHLSNLEWVTKSQNIKHAWDTGLFTNRFANASVKRKGSSSKYVGVSWSNDRKLWCTHIGYMKRTIALGRYVLEEEAAKAYDDYVIQNNLQALGYKTNFN